MTLRSQKKVEYKKINMGWQSSFLRGAKNSSWIFLSNFLGLAGGSRWMCLEFTFWRRNVSVEFDKSFEHPRLPNSKRTYHFASDYISHGLQSFRNMYVSAPSPFRQHFIFTISNKIDFPFRISYILILWKFNRRSIEFYLQKKEEKIQIQDLQMSQGSGFGSISGPQR